MKKTIFLALVVLSACTSQQASPPAPTDPPTSVPPTPPVVESTPTPEDVGFVDDRVERIRGLEPGEVVARLTIPRLGMRLYPARFGIGLAVLALGPAVYPGAAEPGQGNFSLAGHRVTPVGPWSHGPFRYVDTLRRGDLAKVHYKGQVFVYTFVRTIIVDPSNISVLRDGKADMTFTACHPPGSAAQRIVAQWRLWRVKG